MQLVNISNRLDLALSGLETLTKQMLEQNPKPQLAVFCDKYGSDKGAIKPDGHPYPWQAHTYAKIYEMLFSSRRYEVKNVFECGIGTNNIAVKANMTASGKPGASLRVWRDFFPNAMIWGADLDRNILFTEDRRRQRK